MSNTTYLSDAKAVSRVLAGQTDEFGPLVERYLPVAKAAAVGRLGDATEAEDVVQESFLKAYQSLHTLRSPDKFGAWLLGIVRNTCSHAKTRRLRELSRQGKALDNDANAAPDMEAREIRELLHQEIIRLDEKQGEVLLLHYFAGKTLNEIAALLDISRSAAAKRLQRARDALGQQVLSRLEQVDTKYDATKERVSGIMGAISLAQVPWKAAIPAGGTLGIAGKWLWPGFLGSKAAIPALLLISAALYAVLPRTEEQEASPPNPTEPDSAAQIQDAQQAETTRDLTATNPPATSSTAIPAKIDPEASEMRTVQGTVVSEDGFPRPTVEFATNWPFGIYRGTESDADGAFVLKDRTPEQTHWMAYSQNTQKAALFTVGDRTDAPINVILNLDLADIVGRVVDQGNQAVFKAVVETEIATPDGNLFRSDLIVADTHGYYDSRLIPTGDGLSLRVRVRPPGDEPPGEWSDPVQLANGLYQIEIPTIVVPEETAKNIAANQKLDGIPGCYPNILRTAKPRERLAGFIQDPEGNPVAGVYLDLVYDVPSGMVSSSVAVSGKDGSWNCLVPAGLGSVRVRTQHTNYVASMMNREKPAPSLARMREGTSVIVMDPGLMVTGVIRGPDGLPLGDALIRDYPYGPVGDRSQ